VADRAISTDDDLERAERRVSELMVDSETRKDELAGLLPAIFVYRVAWRDELERAAPAGEDKRPAERRG